MACDGEASLSGLFDDELPDDDDIFAFEDEEGIGPSATIAPEIAGLHEPRRNPLSFGHDAQEKQVLEWYRTGRLPHALVMTGPRGVGKATFAYRIARFLLKNGAYEDAGAGLFGDAAPTPETLALSETDPVFARVASGGHPDFMTVERLFDEKKGAEKDEILIDSVRGVAPFMRKTTADGGYRIVIIDDADTMNRNAQNALLKILEEPPANALLMLVAHGAGGLLPTIRSRARVMRFDSLPRETVIRLLRAETPGLDDRTANLLSLIAEGSAGRAVELLRSGGAQGLSELLGTVLALPSASEGAIVKLSESLSGGGPKVLMPFLEGQVWLLGLFARYTAGQTQVMTELANAVPGGGELPAFAARHHLGYWMGLRDRLVAHINLCDQGNLDKRYQAQQALKIMREGLAA